MKFPGHLVSACAALALIGVLTGCASIGAPLPPSLELPKPPTDLRAVRKGDKVYLFWTVPAQTMDRQSVRHQGPTRICRSLEVAMSECGQPVGENPSYAGVVPQPDRTGRTSKAQASYTDTIPPELEQQNPTRMVTYAVEALNGSGRGAGLSNQVQVPLAPTLPPPGNFRTQVISDGVVLTWECGQTRASSSTIHYKYRIYRRSADRGTDAKLADVDCPGPGYEDHTIEWQKSYEYRITVVTSATQDRGILPCPTTQSNDRVVAIPDCIHVAEIEGDDSPVQKVFTNDIYPPGVPTGLQAVFSGTGQPPFVDLLWAPDTDADLAGYNVYRREEGGTSEKVTRELVKTPAFRDTNVAAGRTYLYSVSAVDLRGNESGRSEETGELVPQNP